MDVSGPGIANQRFCGASGQSAQMTAGPLMLKMDVMLQQKRHIFLPFSERGKVQLQDIQAVQKILTEFSSGHGFPQVFVCGGDHADVYRDDRVIAQPYDLLFLKDAQETALELGRDITDLVEENGSPMCDLKETRLSAFCRSGKGAFHISE